MLAQVVHRDRTEGVEADVQRHTLDVQAPEHVLREVQPRGRRRRRPRLVRVHRLVALRVLERLVDVRR
jgi:hypothetical protein